MLLKTLRLVNFRQYKGEQIVHFAGREDKNVTVILGDNTYGKTTLLQSFNWCLFGEVNLDNPKRLLNYDVADGLTAGETAEVVVEVCLLHDGREYIISRSCSYTKIGAGFRSSSPLVEISYLSADGQTHNVKPIDTDKVIQSILPKDLFEYFFFDTERVAGISSKKDLKDAVKGLLGLSVLENAIKHLGDENKNTSAIGRLYASKDTDGAERAQFALDQIAAAEKSLEECGRQLSECLDQAAALEERKKEIDELLSRNGEEEAKRIEEKKSEEEETLKRDEDLLSQTIRALRFDFSRQSMHFFSVPLIERAEQLLKDAKLDDKGIRDLTQATLQAILDRGTCICGREFKGDSAALSHVLEEMRYCPPESIGNAVRNYRSALSSFRGDQEQIATGMADRRANIYSTRERIDDAADMIEELSDQLSSFPDLKSYEAERRDIVSQLKVLSQKRDSLIRSETKENLRLSSNRKTYDSHALASEKNKRIERYISYADEVKKWFAETYKVKEKEIKDDLQERVNSIFNQMYHGTRRAVIGADYQVTLLTDLRSSSRDTGESEGLNRVKNFAFIASLVSLAKGKLNKEEDDFILSSEPYPLVMDAPFSNTDETHIANISRVLPEASEQVVMFVMMKDWRYAEPVLRSRIGASYELCKLSEQHSELRSLDV